MIFTSMDYILFFAALVLIYFIIPKKLQWICLLLASIVFYLSFGLGSSIYILVNIILIYIIALLMQRCDKPVPEGLDAGEKKLFKASVRKKKRLLLALLLVLSLGAIIILKYFDMFFGFAGQNAQQMNIIAPIGISFYTLQSIGYVIDVMRGRYAPQRNPAKLALFVLFFPQIVQGPIGRYNDLAPQLFAQNKFDFTRFKTGSARMLWGYFKKLVIADRVGILVNAVFSDPGNFHGIQVFVAIFCYAIQIYCDFSGYMDIACGSAQILNIRIAENFKNPYFAKSIAEFWRRWHITLGAWFKDYLFYPISVSKGAVNLGKVLRKRGFHQLGKYLPSYLALLFVWPLTGLWHGANWSFMVWGVLNLVFIILSMQFKPFTDGIIKKLHINEHGFFFRAFQIVRTFLLVAFLRVFARAGSLQDTAVIFKRLFTDISKFGDTFPYLGTQDIAIVFLSCVLVLLVNLWERSKNVFDEIAHKRIIIQWPVYFILYFAIIIFGIFGNDLVGGFIYARF